METIQVKDKTFTVSISREEIQKRVSEVAAQISKDLNGKKPLFLAVLNGAFVFAADLIRGISTDCEITFVRLTSYTGTKSTGIVKELIGFNENIEDRHIDIV